MPVAADECKSSSQLADARSEGEGQYTFLTHRCRGNKAQLAAGREHAGMLVCMCVCARASVRV